MIGPKVWIKLFPITLKYLASYIKIVNKLCKLEMSYELKLPEKGLQPISEIKRYKISHIVSTTF